MNYFITPRQNALHIKQSFKPMAVAMGIVIISEDKLWRKTLWRIQ